jgi:ATP-binding cassette subfamily B (MDR/TAP) protein 1
MSGTFAAKHQHLPSSCDEESKTSILIDEAGVNFQLMEEGVGGHDLSTAETAKDGNIEKPVNGGGELVVIQPTEGKGNDADTTKALKSVSLFEILSFADDTDCTLMSIGFFMACLSGLNQPAQLIIFGSLLDSFNGSTKSDSTKAVSFLALMYLVVAIQIFITNFLQTACMSAASGRQAKRMREVYFRALLRQSIAYYDCRDQGALATSVMERTLVIQDGLGEKLALGVQFTMAFFAGLAVAFYYVWQLALLMVGVVPVLTVLIGIAAKT